MKRILLFLLLPVILMSCDEFLEIEPNTSELDTELVFQNDNTAIAALEGVFHQLQENGFASGNIQSVTFIGNILADDAIDYNNTDERYDFYTVLDPIILEYYSTFHNNLLCNFFIPHNEVFILVPFFHRSNLS